MHIQLAATHLEGGGGVPSQLRGPEEGEGQGRVPRLPRPPGELPQESRELTPGALGGEQKEGGSGVGYVGPHDLFLDVENPCNVFRLSNKHGETYKNESSESFFE